MIYPVYGYGAGVLKREAKDIEEDYPNLKQLIADMYETMYEANGVGLACPQIGLSIRMFIIDTEQLDEEGDVPVGVKKAFINPIIVEEEGKEWDYEEGCLSIPDLTSDVTRKPKIIVEYYDEGFNLKEETYDGMNARVIQHESDHLDGILFTDHISGFKRRLMKRKLENIKKGRIDVDYRMKFAVDLKKRK
jgi:peptide deformylase